MTDRPSARPPPAECGDARLTPPCSACRSLDLFMTKKDEGGDWFRCKACGMEEFYEKDSAGKYVEW